MSRAELRAAFEAGAKAYFDTFGGGTKHFEEAHLSKLWQDYLDTIDPPLALDGWTSDFEYFEDDEGYPYEKDLAFALRQDQRIIAYVQVGSGPYDRAFVFSQDVEDGADPVLVFSAELRDEDYDEPRDPEDETLSQARAWCEARLHDLSLEKQIQDAYMVIAELTRLDPASSLINERKAELEPLLLKEAERFKKEAGRPRARLRALIKKTDIFLAEIKGTKT